MYRKQTTLTKLTSDIHVVCYAKRSELLRVLLNKEEHRSMSLWRFCTRNSVGFTSQRERRP